jgi:transposase
VREYLGRAAAAGIGGPLAADVTDESLMARLFVNAGVRAGARLHAEPDWSALVRELKRPGVNLLVLWDEYRAIHCSATRRMAGQRQPDGRSLRAIRMV